MNILLVTHNYENTRFLESAFEDYGDVEVVIDGINGLGQFYDAVETGKFYKVILLDLDQPHMDGMDMSQEIRTFEKINNVSKPAIIMSTNHNRTDSILQGIKNGVDLFLRKPYDFLQIDGFMSECGFAKQ